MLASQKQIAQQYRDLVYAEDPKLNPYAEGGDIWVKSVVYGGLLSGVNADIYLKFLNIWIQNTASIYTDKYLASLCLPQRASAFAAVGQITPTTAPLVDITLPANTQLSYGSTSYTYILLSDVTIAANTTPLIDIASQAIGSGTGIGAGAILQLTTSIPGAPTFTITTMVDGSPEETDAQCITRGLNKFQYPDLNGSMGSYSVWASYIPGVTGSFVLPNVGYQNVVGVYILAGGSDWDSILSYPAIPYSRTATTSLITQVQNYIETQRPPTVPFVVASVDTFQIPDGVIQVEVELVPNVNLTDQLPTFNMTVQELIAREIRRAIIQTPTGGNRVNNLPYLFASDIANALGLGLSGKTNFGGLYATLLLNWKVTLVGGSPDYPLPYLINPTGNYPYVYDVTYDNISISLLGE